MKNSKTNVSLDRLFVEEILGNNTTIPNILLSSYREIGLDDEELVRLLRLMKINKENVLNSKDICQEFFCEEKEVELLLKSLITKGFVLSKNNNYELCLFAKVFDLWAFQKSMPQAAEQSGKKKVNTAYATLYNAFEKEKGNLLSPMEGEQIACWLDIDGFCLDLILEALRRSVMQGKVSFSYVNKILLNWKKQGLKTLDEVQKKDNYGKTTTKTVKKQIEAVERTKSDYDNLF